MKVTRFYYALDATIEPCSSWVDQPASDSVLLTRIQAHLPGLDQFGLLPDRVAIEVETTDYNLRTTREVFTYRELCRPQRRSLGDAIYNRERAATAAAALIYLRSGDFRSDASQALADADHPYLYDQCLVEIFGLSLGNLASYNPELFGKLVQSIEASEQDGHIPIGYDPRTATRTIDELAQEQLQSSVSEYALEQCLFNPVDTRIRGTAIDGLGALYLALEDRGCVGRGRFKALDDDLYAV